MLGKIKEVAKKHWPAIPTVLSAGTLATGIAFGATGQFMMSVGTSNLPMVLALCGASALIIMAFLYTATKHVIYELQDKEEGLIGQVIIAALVIGCGYAAVHFGFAQILPATLTAAESLWAQAGIGFAIGFVLAFVVISVLDKDDFAKDWPQILAGSLAFGVCVAASSAVGPALVAAMGTQAAASATEAIALEATFSISVALFSYLFAFGLANVAQELKGECGKLECMKPRIEYGTV